MEDNEIEQITDALKAGRRNSNLDQKSLDMAHDALVAAGANCGAKDEDTAVKAESLDGLFVEYNTPELAVKMAGEMELDVCYMPYKGQRNGKDSDGQYFSRKTKDWSDKFPTPLALYYHGYKAKGRPQEQPFEIGKTGKRWEDADGRWIRMTLDPTIPEAVKTWNDAKAGKARASSGSINHLVRVEADGHITNWPFVEISVFDTSDGKQPANSYALAKPAAKAHGFDVDEDNTEDINDIARLSAALAVSIIQSQH